MVRQRIFQGGTCTLQVPQPTSPPFALEPLYDAMDQVLECVSSASALSARDAPARQEVTLFQCRLTCATRRQSPRVQLGRPVLTQLVTRLVNADERGIAVDIKEVVQQTLLVRPLLNWAGSLAQLLTCFCAQADKQASTEAPLRSPKLRASKLFDGSVARPKPTKYPTPPPSPRPGSAQRTAAAVLPPEEAAEPQPEEAAEPAKQAEEEDGESNAETIASALASAVVDQTVEQAVDESEGLATINFDAWALSDDELITTCCLMAERLGIAKILNVSSDVIAAYFKACRTQMHADSPFHNWHHVADVTQCLYTLLTQTRLSKVLSPEQLVAVFLAAPAHDLDHRGRSNALEINENSEIAQEFPGEKGPLENHHARLALQTLEETGILAGLERESHDLVRASVKNAILATDMGRHGPLLQRFNTCTADIDVEISTEGSNKLLAEFFVPGDKGWLLLGMLVKASDVSNPSRPIEIADKWNDLVYEEFYAEGDIDKEAGREVNPLHDRQNNVVSKSSVGFIGFVVAPIFESIGNFLEIACKAVEGESSVENHRDILASGVAPFSNGLGENKDVSAAFGHRRRTSLPPELTVLCADPRRADGKGGQGQPRLWPCPYRPGGANREGPDAQNVTADGRKWTRVNHSHSKTPAVSSVKAFKSSRSLQTSIESPAMVARTGDSASGRSSYGTA